MFRQIALSVCSAVVLLSCAPTGPQVTARLSDAPVVSGGTYSSGGGLSLAADLRESNGATLACGVWAQSDQQSILTKGKANRVVSKGSLFLGGQRITQNLLFMKEVPPAASYAGQEAGCRVLDRPWTGATQGLKIRIPRQVVHREVEGLGGGFEVIFRDTGRPEAGGS